MTDRRPPDSSRPAGSASPPEESSFEAALERLESIVSRLEQGDLELEPALAAFEEGVALARRCAERVADAERRIEVLVREGEKWMARPFDDEETGAGGEGSG